MLFEAAPSPTERPWIILKSAKCLGGLGVPTGVPPGGGGGATCGLIPGAAGVMSGGATAGVIAASGGADCSGAGIGPLADTPGCCKLLRSRAILFLQVLVNSSYVFLKLF